ncbi:hypothetical protein NP233_g3110 [Leucocoprinus birnbaumii]|uniref:Conserved oligomeric Golgi complex subunit 5 n=1 Tax=Leucocoprinus birnbaumii TaxID=56174 RepID=A0AAD5YU89_9AGAR|nr:hypothetical protein NP233_g3110 [Leucocoprinus birnbaumii]
MSDYSVFASPAFDPNDYANAILAGEPYPPQSDAKATSKPALNLTKSATQESIAKEDLSVAISKLTFGIDDVSKQIRNLVTVHHENLLEQASNANKLDGSLISVRQGLKDLDLSADKLRAKIHAPYEALQTHVSRLHKLHQASDVLRRTSRFVILARRLQAQMEEMDDRHDTDGDTTAETRDQAVNGQTLDVEDEKERAIAKAALSIAELISLLEGTSDEPTRVPQTEEDGSSSRSDEDEAIEDISLRSINAVSAYEPYIQDARVRVTSEMESMVLMGLRTLNQTLLASSLQTAYNLRVLPTLVQRLLSDLSQAVEERIQSAFDLSRISKDALATESGASPNLSQSPAAYRSRVRTEPTSATVPQYTAALWARLEAMFEEMTECCTRVYTLEKVLKMKKDTITQVVFLDEAMKLLENKPSAIFWSSLTRSLEKNDHLSFKTLSGVVTLDYYAYSTSFSQRLLCTRTPYISVLIKGDYRIVGLRIHANDLRTPAKPSPETILVLRAISNIETLYLSRSTNKLNEVVGQAFSGGVRAPPGSAEGVNVARAVANELDAARFDPLLVKSVAKIAASSLDMMLSRTENLVTRDRSAFTFIGPTASPQQINNGQLASFLNHSWARLSKLGDEYSDSVYGILQPSTQNLYRSYERLTDPLLAAVRRDLGSIIASMHRIDFGKSVDPLAGMGRSSLYTKELTEKLGFFKSEVLSKYDVGDVNKLWIASIVKYAIKTFLLHASIVKPLGESGKLQLTSDMTEIEFALNAFVVDTPQSKSVGGLETIGSEYRSLRAMRPLLFLENSQLTSSKYTAGLPVLIVLHHILEAEYVRWVDEHSEMEALTLVDSGLSHWEKMAEADEKDTSEAADQTTHPPSMASILAGGTLRASRTLSTRAFSTSLRAFQQNDNIKLPQPPKPIDDSTSALDYKRSHRIRPPPLPAMDLPRVRSAEEAVTNILYNTPPPSLQPFKKHILNCLVQNEPGVLSRVSGILAGRGFNIDSLVVCRTEIRDLSRMCIVLSGQDGVVEQARRQLEDLVPVWAVLDYTETSVIQRELLLVKVSILGPEYLEEQFAGGPSHDPRQADASKLEREAALAENFERSAAPGGANAAHQEQQLPPITPSEALRLKHQHLHSVSVLAKEFGARIVDIAENSVIVELTAKTPRVEAFLSLLKPFGILESARTGLMAMPRTPIVRTGEEDEAATEQSGPVDASLLPPG